MPTTTSAIPIGVIEKMPSPPWPSLRSIRSSASRNAGALTRVRVVPSDAASDIGISSRDAGSFRSRACRTRIGSIIAVTMTWWVNAASAATAGITTAIARDSLRPAARPTHWPRRSVMPVAASPPEITNTAATMIAGSLANPDSACFASSTPPSTSASSTSIALTSIRRRSLTNRYRPPARISRNRICSDCIGGARRHAALCTRVRDHARARGAAPSTASTQSSRLHCAHPARMSRAMALDIPTGHMPAPPTTPVSGWPWPVPASAWRSCRWKARG